MSPSHASALLRSAMAIASELMGASFPAMVRGLAGQAGGKPDSGAGALAAQRHVAARAADLQRAFLARLQEAQDQYLTELTASHSAGPTSAFDAETLSLVDEISVDSSTVVDRHANRIAGLIEQPVSDLNLVVGALLGRPSLRTSENPLGPSVYVRALMSAAEDTELGKEASAGFLAIFEKPLAEELGNVARQLLEHFVRHGADVKAIRRSMAIPRTSWSATQVGGSTVMGGNTLTGGNTRMGGDTQMGGNTLMGGNTRAGALGGSFSGRDELTMQGPVTRAGSLSGGGGAAFRSTVMGGGASAGASSTGASRGVLTANEASEFLGGLLTQLRSNVRDARAQSKSAAGPAPPQLLQSIGQFQQHDLQGLESGAALSVMPAPESVAALRQELISKSTRTVDKLTIELVGMLFDHVMQDKQVPAEIKARLSRLQFPVLKAALMDAAFFASSAHPARRLIDRIASTSAGWEPYGDDNQGYLKEVDRIVTDILRNFESDVGVFERVYGEFDKFVSDIQPEDNDPVARAKKALEAAEKHEVLTINTTIQVRRAFERVFLEPYMREFLLGPWVKVLVAAAVRNEVQPGFAKAFRDVIHELVWSVQPKASNEDRSRLVKLIPGMVRVVRDGLALINMPERERDEFLKHLMESHAMAVKPVDQATYIKSSLMASDLRVQIDQMQLSGAFPVGTVAGGIRVSTGLIMRQAKEHDAEILVPEAATDIARLDPMQDAQIQEEIGRWQRGTWFKLWNGTEFQQVKLRWMSPLRTLFLFSGEHNQKAHVLSADTLKSYLARKYIEPLESVPLMKRAVDAVVADFEGAPDRAKELANRYAASKPA
ncbi:MAG: DUF1631 family protein [Betaproteobacteria bacterium]